MNEPYVLSFCASGSTRVSAHGLLSQWLGYGKDGGYSIAFDTAGLEKLWRREAETARGMPLFMGTASWLLRYMDHGNAKSVGLGAYPGTSLQKTRGLAAPIPWQLKGSRYANRSCNRPNPRPSRPAPTNSSSSRGLLGKNAKHGQQWLNTLTQYAFPVIGENPISDIHTDDIVRILSPIWQDKTETATRLRGRIEAVIVDTDVVTVFIGTMGCPAW